MPSDIQNMIQRIEIGKQTLTLTCSKSTFRNWLLNDKSQANFADDTFTLTTKFTLRRRGVETKLILDQHAMEHCIDPALIKVVAQGHQWNRQFQEGEFASIAELAKKIGVSRPHVSRVIKLGGLAPDIVEMILAGEQPTSLTAQKLTHIKDFPYNWNQQREAFGFAALKA